MGPDTGCDYLPLHIKDGGALASKHYLTFANIHCMYIWQVSNMLINVNVNHDSDDIKLPLCRRIKHLL